MIPGLVKRIAAATMVLGLIGLLCIMVYDRAAGVTFALTTLWMIGHLLIWTVIMRVALRPKNEPRALLILMPALFAKLLLLIGGVVALYLFAPYSKSQVWAMVAGIGSVSFVAALKALGARLASKKLSPGKNNGTEVQARA